MDINDIKKIAELMQEFEVNKLELEEETFRLAMTRGNEHVQMVAAPAPMVASAPAAPAASAAAAAPAVDEDAGLVDIKSPIVGTFYRASSPESDVFVKVGQAVEPDTVVCIVEAMKVMNEIKAEVKGTIEKILIENASPVAYGQPLFKVKP